MPAIYSDSFATVKLAVREPESEGLRRYRHPPGDGAAARVDLGGLCTYDDWMRDSVEALSVVTVGR